MRPAKRLRAKTPPPQRQQQPLPALPDFAAGEDATQKRQVYLVSLPHPRQQFSSTGVRLRPPGELSRDRILDCVKDACKHPVYVDAHSQGQGFQVELKKATVFRELHRPDEQGAAFFHFHVGLLAARSFRFTAVKRALLARHGLASHWSCSHDGYWSTVRYGCCPSETKPLEALDPHPLPWSADGQHPPLQECCHPPLTAAALHGRRVAVEQRAAEEGTQAPKITELDVWPIVVRQGFRNTQDDPTAHLQLIAYVKKHCSTAMQAFLFKHRHRLSTLIEDIWQWECVEDVLTVARRSRLGSLRVAAAAPCECQGGWLTTVVQSFMANKINVQELCKDVLAALTHGRCETTPAVVLAGAQGGEGKSLFFKALHSVYEDGVFTPAESNFPMVGVDQAKVVFLDEWRFNDKIVSYANQCLWFDGSAVPVARPQNIPGVRGHFLYRGSAPIFSTTKLSDIEALGKLAAIDPQTNRPKNSEASMLYRRLKIYAFETRIDKPTSQYPFCKRCFAQLVLQQAGAATLDS